MTIIDVSDMGVSNYNWLKRWGVMSRFVWFISPLFQWVTLVLLLGVIHNVTSFLSNSSQWRVRK
jgi:hypothetical protein